MGCRREENGRRIRNDRMLQMKITVITSPFHELPPVAIGAVEKLFYQLAGEWVKNGNEIVFLCCGGGADERMKFVRLKKYNRTGSTKKDLIWDFFYSIKALWKCPKTDVLVCNTFWTPVFAPFFRWKYRRLIYGVHRYPKGQYWLYPFVHVFICVSTVVARALQNELGNDSRIRTIINPIDDVVFNSAVQRHCVKGRVLYAGRVHPAKGLLCLAHASKQLYERGECLELVLVGGHEKEKGGGGEDFVAELRDAAKPCPLKMTGSISSPCQLADIERSAEVFVYPSEDSIGEACPIAPMEAMALGVPTVVSDLKCFDDYVSDKVNAIRFKTGDVADLVQKISYVLSDANNAQKLCAEAAKSMGKYSARNVAIRYIDVFASVCADE